MFNLILLAVNLKEDDEITFLKTDENEKKLKPKPHHSKKFEFEEESFIPNMKYFNKLVLELKDIKDTISNKLGKVQFF